MSTFLLSESYAHGDSERLPCPQTCLREAGGCRARNPAKETQQKKRGLTAAASLQKLTCYSDNVQGSLLFLLCRGTRSPEHTARCAVEVALLPGKQHQLCAFTRPGIQHLWRGPLTYDAFLLQLCKPNKKIRIDLFLNFPLNSDVVNNKFHALILFGWEHIHQFDNHWHQEIIKNNSMYNVYPNPTVPPCYQVNQLRT